MRRSVYPLDQPNTGGKYSDRENNFNTVCRSNKRLKNIKTAVLTLTNQGFVLPMNFISVTEENNLNRVTDWAKESVR